jgi:hypothetical protein
MKKVLFGVLVICFGYGSLFAQQKADPDITTLKFSVTDATDWTNFFKRNSGWFGGDGIYTIPLNGKEEAPASSSAKTLFIFSDSMIGEVHNDTIAPGATMIHNAVAILQGNKPNVSKLFTWWDKDKKGKPESVFIPTTPRTEAKDYYWLGDGFANQKKDNAIYIFGYRIRNVGTGTFGFKEVGNTLIKVKTNGTLPFKSIEQMDTPFYIDQNGENGSFGAGIYVNTKKAGAPKPDGYVYVYGVKGQAKKLLVARVLPQDFEAFDKWTFWNGTTWDSQMDNAATMADKVSNELSVSAMPDGRYIMVFQINTMSRGIGVRIGKTPYGPFGPTIKIWDCSDAITPKTYFTYNAKAHPSLSKPGELIISYNVNSMDFFKDLKKEPTLYRPRFIRLKFL